MGKLEKVEKIYKVNNLHTRPAVVDQNKHPGVQYKWTCV